MSKLGLLNVYLSTDNIVDLHGALGSVAVGILDFILSKPWPVPNKDMLIITGKGIHSEGDPVLYKTCIEFVSNKYKKVPDIIRIDPSNKGCFYIRSKYYNQTSLGNE
jgi:DNA-nicking Smr family endonuclease